MPTIDPTQYSGPSGGGSYRECGPGRKTLFPIGHRFRRINDNDVVDIRSVCIQDEHGDDCGAVVTDTFWLTERAMWRIARFALSVGFDKPFDPMDAEDMDKVILSGPFIGTLVKTKRNDRERIEIRTHEKADGFTRNDRTGDINLTDEQIQWVESAERGWRSLLSKSFDSPSHSGGGNSPGGGSAPDDGIPF